jgi:peptide subunit release factor 1 (eRF1)
MPQNEGAISLESYPALRFQPDTLDRLTRMEAPSEGVLSVYLDVDPSQMQREGFEASLLDLWKPLRAEMKGTDREERLEQEIDRVNTYVRSWDEAPGRSVAIFSCAPGDLFVPVALDVPVLAGARFWPRPYLLPLIAALDEHERYCVALVDKERARILTVWMERIQQRIEFEAPLPGRIAGGGWATGGAPRGRGKIAEMGPGRVHSSQAGYVRHVEYHVHLHMQRVVDELWRLSQQQTFDRLIIGGTKEAIAALRPMLPRSLATRVVGEFAGEMYASDADVLGRVRGIEEKAERAYEAALVTDILERAPKAQLAATGWDDTLTALSEGRVHRLVLIEGVTTAGFACPEGHFVAKGSIEQCPLCDEPLWPVGDLAARAARLAMVTDADVEFVRGEAADLLRPYGAGAILRYQ